MSSAVVCRSVLKEYEIKLRPILKYWNGKEYVDIQERKVDPIMRLFVDCRVSILHICATI